MVKINLPFSTQLSDHGFSDITTGPIKNVFFIFSENLCNGFIAR